MSDVSTFASATARQVIFDLKAEKRTRFCEDFRRLDFGMTSLRNLRRGEQAGVI